MWLINIFLHDKCYVRRNRKKLNNYPRLLRVYLFEHHVAPLQIKSKTVLTVFRFGSIHWKLYWWIGPEKWNKVFECYNRLYNKNQRWRIMFFLNLQIFEKNNEMLNFTFIPQMKKRGLVNGVHHLEYFYPSNKLNIKFCI